MLDKQIRLFGQNLNSNFNEKNCHYFSISFSSYTC